MLRSSGVGWSSCQMRCCRDAAFGNEKSPLKIPTGLRLPANRCGHILQIPVARNGVSSVFAIGVAIQQGRVEQAGGIMQRKGLPPVDRVGHRVQVIGYTRGWACSTTTGSFDGQVRKSPQHDGPHNSWH
jgi:hypothetical protein